MSFEEKFPSFKGTTYAKVEGINCIYEHDVERHCLDKNKVKEAISKVLGITHFSGVPIITMREKREDRHDYFDALKKELELCD